MNWFSVFKILVVCTTFTFLTTETNGAKILSIFGYPGPSQYIMASALLKGLAERGHEVTSISTFPQKTAVKNFRDIAVMENAKLFDGFTSEAIVDEQESNFFQEMSEFNDIGAEMVENVLKNPKVKDIMKNEKFDLIIMETIMTDALYGFGQHFNAPMVGVSTFGTMNFIDVLVGNISPLSYIPHVGLPYDTHMSLKERILNTVFTIIDDLHLNYVRLPTQEKIFHKYFPNSKLTFDEARTNFSLVLLNQHFTLSYPRPYVTNMIEVGGLHIKQKADPLPQDLQEFLDNAKEGAIYFSMGSNLKSKDIPAETLKEILDTFRELKLKVLWKFEAETLPNKPDNVYIKSWYPQPSVLAHPNVKLFISHGGFLSTTETIFHGKPILGIPIFGDQPMNVKNAVKGGYALSLKLNNLTKESFKSTIMELLINDRYTKRVQQLSKQYRDQPQTPLDKAIYWVEYVLRHEGAPHMRNAGLDLNYFQQNNIDVFAILAGGFLLFFAVLVICIRLVVKVMCTKKTTKKSSGKGKNKSKIN
ncbi:UDP-glucosyltransferase 2-like [Calliphora vicina]|uniref:UDP-glucosyltransferase 2-like n=1 Tax=Calliphora vicina TaxID=7373 RepID=UPI00325AFADE